jgi:hypothetical protein
MVVGKSAEHARYELWLSLFRKLPSKAITENVLRANRTTLSFREEPPNDKIDNLC